MMGMVRLVKSVDIIAGMEWRSCIAGVSGWLGLIL